MWAVRGPKRREGNQGLPLLFSDSTFVSIGRSFPFSSSRSKKGKKISLWLMSGMGGEGPVFSGLHDLAFFFKLSPRTSNHCCPQWENRFHSFPSYSFFKKISEKREGGDFKEPLLRMEISPQITCPFRRGASVQSFPFSSFPPSVAASCNYCSEQNFVRQAEASGPQKGKKYIVIRRGPDGPARMLRRPHIGIFFTVAFLSPFFSIARCICAALFPIFASIN